jgi:hypothetical protein
MRIECHLSAALAGKAIMDAMATINSPLIIFPVCMFISIYSRIIEAFRQRCSQILTVELRPGRPIEVDSVIA